MVFARLFTGGTIKHLNMWGSLINSTLSSVALSVLRHGGCCTASNNADIRVACYIHISPFLPVDLATAGQLNSAWKLEFLSVSKAFWRLPSASHCNFTQHPLQLTKQDCSAASIGLGTLQSLGNETKQNIYLPSLRSLWIRALWRRGF